MIKQLTSYRSIVLSFLLLAGYQGYSQNFGEAGGYGLKYSTLLFLVIDFEQVVSSSSSAAFQPVGPTGHRAGLAGGGVGGGG